MKHRRGGRRTAEHGTGLHDDVWPGCMVSGHIKVNRVPGNFHIEAASKSHTFNGVSVYVMKGLGGGVPFLFYSCTYVILGLGFPLHFAFLLDLLTQLLFFILPFHVQFCCSDFTTLVNVR